MLFFQRAAHIGYCKITTEASPPLSVEFAEFSLYLFIASEASLIVSHRPVGWCIVSAWYIYIYIYIIIAERLSARLMIAH